MFMGVSPLQAEKLVFSTRSEVILETSNWSSKTKDQGFYIRLKPREDYFAVAINEGEGHLESEGEPLLNVVDRESPLGNPVVYGFSLVTGRDDRPGRVRSVVQVNLIFHF